MSDSRARTIVASVVLNVLRVAWSVLGAAAGIAAFIAAVDLWDLEWIGAWNFPEVGGVTLAGVFVPWLGAAALGAVVFARLWTVVHARVTRRSLAA